jgi:hypothetical protein
MTSDKTFALFPRRVKSIYATISNALRPGKYAAKVGMDMDKFLLVNVAVVVYRRPI